MSALEEKRDRKNAVAGNLCGIFALVAIGAALWIGASTIWDARYAIIDIITSNPAATVLCLATFGFACSFIYGIRS